MVLDSVNTYKNAAMETFGYKTVFVDHKLKVGFLFNDSQTGANALQLNDDILRIDTMDFTHISKSDYCKLILDTTQSVLTSQTISIKRDSVVLKFPLTKAVILE